MKYLKKIKSLSVIKKTNFFIRFKKPDGIRFTKRTLRIVGCSVALMILAATAHPVHQAHAPHRGVQCCADDSGGNGG